MTYITKNGSNKKKTKNGNKNMIELTFYPPKNDKSNKEKRLGFREWGWFPVAMQMCQLRVTVFDGHRHTKLM